MGGYNRRVSAVEQASMTATQNRCFTRDSRLLCAGGPLSLALLNWGVPTSVADGQCVLRKAHSLKPDATVERVVQPADSCRLFCGQPR
jgi:hypothetical protein